MPLYLVRWPSLTATLIRARSEANLMDIIDQIASPGGCVWSVYRGPLMIDFAVPLEHEVNRRFPGRTRAEDVTIRGELDLEGGEALEVQEPDGCDTSSEMHQAIMRQAFPSLAAVIYDADEDAATADDVKRAAAADIEAQAMEAERVGVTFGDGTELLRTQVRCYRRVRPAEFEEVSANAANDFCCGLNPMTPDAQDLVHLAYVDVAVRRNRPVSARLTMALRLRVDANHIVIAPHRADAYQSGTFTYDALHRQRNDAVTWKISVKDKTCLERSVGCDIDDGSASD